MISLPYWCNMPPSFGCSTLVAYVFIHSPGGQAYFHDDYELMKFYEITNNFNIG